MGLDVGPTGVKAMAFTPEGEVLARAYREYPELYPKPGWIGMNPNEIWRSTTEVIREVALKTRKDPIKALSLSVLGEAVTPLGKDGKALYNSITSVDKRSIEEARWLEETLGRKYLFQRTGMPAHPSYTVSKLLWIKNHRPHIFEKTWKFLLYEDFILYRLGLEPTIDYSLAARTMIFNIHTKTWSDEILEKSGIKVEELHAIGGGAKSQEWLQIKADITGKKFINLEISDAGCLGAAILAGKGIGIYTSFEEAIQKLIRYKKVFSPQERRRKEYEKKYRTYKKLYPSLKEINSEL